MVPAIRGFPTRATNYTHIAQKWDQPVRRPCVENGRRCQRARESDWWPVVGPKRVKCQTSNLYASSSFQIHLHLSSFSHRKRSQSERAWMAMALLLINVDPRSVYRPQPGLCRPGARWNLATPSSSHLDVFVNHPIAPHNPAAAATLLEKHSAVFSDGPRILFGG